MGAEKEQEKKQLEKKRHHPQLMARDFLRYIGPGLLVAVGFIDPGNWASNVAAGSQFGYSLLWMVTLSTIMLIILQHNAAHLGIASGLCLSEAATMHLRPWLSRIVLTSAMVASVSTAMAEILGGAIALQMLFHLPLKLGAVIILAIVLWMLFAHSYKKLERWIIGFVSVIGLSFIVEIILLHVDWSQAAAGWVSPTFPHGSLPIVMSVLGAVVMPHNLFLHSEVIQSRQWHLQDEAVIRRELKFEFMDTILSMGIGWAINSAMILVAAAVFFTQGITVDGLDQAQIMLKPLLGNTAAIIFALALLFAGIASSVTAGMAGGSIFAGLYKEPYDINDSHTRIGVAITLIAATFVIFFISQPFQGLIISQMILSIQLPITVFLLLYLTSSPKIMGKYANTWRTKVTLFTVALIVTVLNIMLFITSLSG